MKNLAFLGGVLVILLVIIVVIASINKPKASTTASASTATDSYFDDNTKVMYFWQEGCHFCQQQKPILEELNKEFGYKVKSMDVGKNAELWQTYNITGTPTFIAADGSKLVGFQEKDKLKEFLEKNK